MGTSTTVFIGRLGFDRNFLQTKLAANKARDRQALEAFDDQGWMSLVIWECEISDRSALAARLL